jgi:beta-fructofuranosidase
MLIRSARHFAKGERIEFWARAKGAEKADFAPFSLQNAKGPVYRIAQLPSYFAFYSHTHYADEEVILEWDDEAVDISLAYVFGTDSVTENGVAFLEFTDGAITEWPKATWPDRYAADGGRPSLRFSPFKGWMNDPNGLCRVGDAYHLFYQFYPNGTDWGPMHWGHAVSRDLYRWTHLPVFLHPEQNLEPLQATGGAFSGNAFIDRDGTLSFYYTERLPAYDLFKDYKEIQKRATPSPDLIKPVGCEIVLEYGPADSAHDFRDPKVWFDAGRGIYRMILGAAIDGDPAVLLYDSADGTSWKFNSVLYRAPDHFREHGARCVECPDFFQIDGHWVLVMGFVGYTDPETGRHNLLYASTGTFENDRFQSHDTALQELDFGTDYYAMQSFAAGDRQLAFAWLFNWEFRKPAGSDYSGELSLPRVLGLDADLQLTMTAEPGYRSLRQTRLNPDNLTIRPEAGTAVEIALRGTLENVRIVASDGQGNTFVIAHENGRLLVRAPEDDGNISYRSRPIALADLSVFFDHGVVEIFANDGTVCGTRRSYRLNSTSLIEVQIDDPAKVAFFDAWQLSSAWGRQ